MAFEITIPPHLMVGTLNGADAIRQASHSPMKPERLEALAELDRTNFSELVCMLRNIFPSNKRSEDLVELIPFFPEKVFEGCRVAWENGYLFISAIVDYEEAKKRAAQYCGEIDSPNTYKRKFDDGGKIIINIGEAWESTGHRATKGCYYFYPAGH
ncbi:hypothetical protein FJZ19_05865 [Candidatus Pacearchaeota archaeon]|nr:hypothetical protein [Candidatus Pacearchaeota archaeon]